MNNKLIQKIQSSQGILFDMDGVLTDSMPRHCSAWIQAFKKVFNIQLSEKEIYEREGEKSEKSIPEILNLHKVQTTPEERTRFLEFKTSLFKNAGPVLFFKGIENFIQVLSSHKQLGLVTGTQRDEVEALLPESFRNHFEGIITSSELCFGKPDPEPYLKGVKSLDLSPHQVLVIENAPLGIQSAKKAGIEVLALGTTLPFDHLKEADYFCQNHEELYEIFSIALNDVFSNKEKNS